MHSANEVGVNSELGPVSEKSMQAPLPPGGEPWDCCGVRISLQSSGKPPNAAVGVVNVSLVSGI